MISRFKQFLRFAWLPGACFIVATIFVLWPLIGFLTILTVLVMILAALGELFLDRLERENDAE